ncbi:hypothetical protein P7K49_001130 [Saguinus oedipus]|uniref:Uncharacterized protein n=1 Tax=Saguinus oedipus TaxID=9490 RepID=A0ABQ9WDM0_SAGOE|nr:hypothetical protein P7K49_001130 [Saguinus oedipus]
MASFILFESGHLNTPSCTGIALPCANCSSRKAAASWRTEVGALRPADGAREGVTEVHYGGCMLKNEQ